MNRGKGMEIGQLEIKEWRKGQESVRGMTQVILAASLGVSPEYMCQVELGTKNISRAMIRKFEEIYGVKINPLREFRRKEKSRAK